MRQKFVLEIAASLFFLCILALPQKTQAASSWVAVGPTGFSAGEIQGGSAINLGLNISTIAFNPSTNEPYVAFQDLANSSKATVMKYDGLSWSNVGPAGFGAGTAQNISITFNPSTSEPYVVFQDASNSFNATVMRFDGTNWVNVGVAGFEGGGPGAYTFIAMAFNPATHEPYVLFQDGNLKATVMRYNGSSWINVGSPSFSAGTAWDASIAFNPVTNEPYVAYQDSSVSPGKATVMKFDGINWVTVGAPGFSTNEVYSTHIAFNRATNEPYVLFEEFQPNAADKAAVMRYDGSKWIYVGSPFSMGGTILSNLVFNPETNEPYVSYLDSSKATTMKFNGAKWIAAGMAKFSAGQILHPSVAFNPATKEPYVFYKDLANFGKATVMKYPIRPGVTIAGISKTSADVNYQSLTPAKLAIYYGTSVKKGKIVRPRIKRDDNFYTAHDITLSRLKKNTKYYYQIVAQNADGTTNAKTKVKSFKTKKK